MKFDFRVRKFPGIRRSDIRRIFRENCSGMTSCTILVLELQTMIDGDAWRIERSYLNEKGESHCDAIRGRYWAKFLFIFETNYLFKMKENRAIHSQNFPAKTTRVDVSENRDIQRLLFQLIAPHRPNPIKLWRVYQLWREQLPFYTRLCRKIKRMKDRLYTTLIFLVNYQFISWQFRLSVPYFSNLLAPSSVQFVQSKTARAVPSLFLRIFSSPLRRKFLEISSVVVREISNYVPIPGPNSEVGEERG